MVEDDYNQANRLLILALDADVFNGINHIPRYPVPENMVLLSITLF